MRCRKCINGNVVWFGKTSLTSTIVENYSEGVEAVKDSLTQRLSVIKSELWYQINYGLPLFEKHTSPAVFDAAIYDIIISHPAVTAIKSFKSSKTNDGMYTFSCEIITNNSESLVLSNQYLL